MAELRDLPMPPYWSCDCGNDNRLVISGQVAWAVDAVVGCIGCEQHWVATVEGVVRTDRPLLVPGDYAFLLGGEAKVAYAYIGLAPPLSTPICAPAREAFAR